jgi:uncharacterized membrane protein
MMSVGQMAAEDLVNSSSAIYIVPGLSAELFINFGVGGILFGYLALGLLVGWIDTKFAKSQTIILQLFWAYVGTIFAFYGVVSNGEAVISLVLLRGAPLVVMGAISHLSNRREAQSQRSHFIQSSEPEPEVSPRP